MVTHGLFTGMDWRRLWSLGVRRIFCTDTIPPRREIVDDSRITILSIVQLLDEHVARSLSYGEIKPCGAA